MRTGVTATVAVLCSAIVGLGAAPSALGKTKRCKRGTVPVRVLHTTTCRPLKKAIPRPKAGDPRVAAIDAALGLDVSFLRDRHGHRLRALSQLGGGRAYHAIIRNLPTALTRLDKLAFPRGRPALARLASAGCQGIGGPASGSSAYGGSDGSSVSLDSSANGDATVTMTTNAGNGTKITVQFLIGECSHFKAPSCPTAAGRLEGTDSDPLLLRTKVTQNGKLLRLNSTEIEDTQQLVAQMAGDAKFDTLDISDAYSFRTTVGGSQLPHAVTITGRVVHRARVNLRTGNLAPGQGSVIVNATVDGATVSDAELSNVASQGQKAADDAFAKIAEKEIGRFRRLETNIDEVGACAKLSFSPRSNALTVNPGDHGTFTPTIESNGGGEPTLARWTLTSQKNAAFSPTSSQSLKPTVSYTVSGSPSGSTISVTVKATSTAGVDQQTWQQKLRTLNVITGTFTGHATDAGVIYDWTGTATFTRNGAGGSGGGGAFQLTSGSATVTVSGSQNGSGCDQTGTSIVGLVQGSSWTVTGTQAPYSYSIIAPFQSTSLTATNQSCTPESGKSDGSSESLGSMPSPALQSGDLTSLFKTTNDLFHYTGSATATLFLDPGQTESWTWSMTGST